MYMDHFIICRETLFTDVEAGIFHKVSVEVEKVHIALTISSSLLKPLQITTERLRSVPDVRHQRQRLKRSS
jgi:hypothetical protein